MELSAKNKQHIDSMSYEQLLSHWRFAPVGDSWFQGDTGEYWGARMKELLSQENDNSMHVQASKNIGWDK